MHKNIQQLYEKNSGLLEAMTFDPAIDDPAELCNRQAYRNTGLFSETMIDAMFDNWQTERIRRFVPHDIGMILIRPDMLHAVNRFEQFISERFKLLHAETVCMDRNSYWQIYQHDFYRPETMHTRLTRAAMYIGSQCRLVVFKDQQNMKHDTTADYVHAELKGSQGVYKPGTLRGDIVYCSARTLGYDRLDDSCDRRIPVAVDPFGAYRSLARSASGPHAGVDAPLLFYTGVGVHVPNGAEIETDLPVLFDIENITITQDQ